MSANQPQAAPAGVNVENNDVDDALMNISIRTPIFHLRDRMFQSLFIRSAAVYARALPLTARRLIEFFLLLLALSSFFMLIYIHVVFSRTSFCLHNIKDVWPRDGILRVEIITNPSPDYNIKHSYAREQKLKQGKVDEAPSVLGLLTIDNFINIEPSTVAQVSQETEPLDQTLVGEYFVERHKNNMAVPIGAQIFPYCD